MPAGFKDRWTPEGKAFLRAIAEMSKKPHVKVGFPQKTFSKAKKTNDKKSTSYTLGEVAVVNEFGTAPGTLPKIPERSFMRASFDKNVEDFAHHMQVLENKVILGKMDTKTAMGLAGEMVKKEIQKEIHAGGTPFTPNAPSTIDAKTRAGKEGDHPLNDTGQMAQSVTYERLNCE